VFAEEAGAALDFSASVSLARASLVRVVASEPCKPRLDQSVMPAMTKLGWSENSRELGEQACGAGWFAAAVVVAALDELVALDAFVGGACTFALGAPGASFPLGASGALRTRSTCFLSPGDSSSEREVPRHSAGVSAAIVNAPGRKARNENVPSAWDLVSKDFSPGPTSTMEAAATGLPLASRTTPSIELASVDCGGEVCANAGTLAKAASASAAKSKTRAGKFNLAMNRAEQLSVMDAEYCMWRSGRPQLLRVRLQLADCARVV